MQFSHSRVETFNQCAYKFKLRYIDKLEVLPDFNPSDPLILGTTLHVYLQESPDAAWEYYKNQYPILYSKHYEEFSKLETIASKFDVNELEEMTFEKRLTASDFIGFIDAVSNDKIIDFKYAKNAERYKESKQLSLYKYFYEKIYKKEINRLFYLVFPKTAIYKGKYEEEYEFKRRLEETLSTLEPEIIEIKYNPNHVIEWYADVKRVLEAKEYPKNENKLCDWCEYQSFCKEGIDYMILPSVERRNIEKVTKRTLWLYGAPFTGKTTFTNKFPNPLMLNTDGNIKFVDAPFISLKDEQVKNGRLVEQVFAWEKFKEVIATLQTTENEFKTIIVDLVEDLYESCRLYMYDKLKITHESDDSFRAWDKVRTEYLSVMRSFFNLDYENLIILSHENITKDITKRSGENVKAIQPNISEKPMLKLAGMVDIVGRVVVEDDKRFIEIKPEEHIFGGGRLGIKGAKIPLDFEMFCEVYETGVNKKTDETPVEEPKKRGTRKTKKEEPVDEVIEEEEPVEEVIEEEEPVEEKPKTRTRSRRTRPTTTEEE